MNTIPYRQYLEASCAIAKEAGALLMRYFATDFATQHKSDKSPVTDADIAANALIREGLLKLAPHIPVIAEEDESFTPGAHAVFWLVDPLDGTLSFVRREKEFSVNIALVKDRRPVLGVIYAPPQDALYYAAEKLGAFRKMDGKKTAIAAREAPEKLTVTRSRSHPSAATAAYLRRIDVAETISMSSAIKFCLVAEGRADLYPRFGRTMEWDTAAGHAIINEAGGRVETADGKKFLYGKPHFENPPFIAYGRL